MSIGGPSDRQQAHTSGVGGRAGGPPRTAHGPGSGGRSNEPPNLLAYSDTPRYDLTTVVQLVGVRPIILWGWEQHLGIPSPTRINEEAGGAVRRYSERDLVASLWLREQILDGTPPPEAAARLRAAQRPVAGDDGAWGASDPGRQLGARVNTGPLPNSFDMQRSPNWTRPLNDLDRTPPSGLGAAEQVGPHHVSYGPALERMPSGAYSSPPSSSQVWVSKLSGPLTSEQRLSASGTPVISGPVVPPVTAARPTGQLSLSAGAVPSRGQYPVPSGLLPGPLPPPHVPPGLQSGPQWPRVSGTASASTYGRELHALMPQLVRAFANFDTLGANHVFDEAMSSRTIETVCQLLLLPALSRVSDQWASHQMTMAEERFATNYVRGLLFAQLHATPERVEAPAVWVGCGPREQNDIYALVLAVFMRRAGLRVTYLGQGVEGAELVEEARKRRPPLVALSITSTQRIRSLARIAKAVNQLEAPRPMLVFNGPIFIRNPELLRKVNGIYLGDDPGNATFHAKKLLGVDTPALG